MYENLRFKPFICLSDFEIVFQKAIKNIFVQRKMMGCYLLFANQYGEMSKQNIVLEDRNLIMNLKRILKDYLRLHFYRLKPMNKLLSQYTIVF